MKRKVNKGACLLLALALFLLGAGLWNTMGTQGLMQYVLIAPKEEGAIAQLVKKKDNEELAIGVSTITATASGVSVSAKNVDSSTQATLFAGTENFFEVYPRYLTAGRLFSQTELKKGEKLAVLDEDMAFQLFPTIDPLGQKIQIDGVELEVIGVVHHEYRVGDLDKFSVYAPLLALQNANYSIVTLSAKPMPGSGMSVTFETMASDYWASGGYCYNLEKEASRAFLPVRYTLVAFGIAAIVWIVHLLNRFLLDRVQRVRMRFKREYLPTILPQILLYILLFLVLYGLVCVLAWLLASWAVAPLYQFPEWVPESIVKWSSIRDVFWNLAISSVQMVNVATTQVRALQFWAGVVRWGVLLTLVSVILFMLDHRRRQA